MKVMNKICSIICDFIPSVDNQPLLGSRDIMVSKIGTVSGSMKDVFKSTVLLSAELVQSRSSKIS